MKEILVNLQETFPGFKVQLWGNGKTNTITSGTSCFLESLMKNLGRDAREIEAVNTSQ
jgi:hypothetical protein